MSTPADWEDQSFIQPRDCERFIPQSEIEICLLKQFGEEYCKGTVVRDFHPWGLDRKKKKKKKKKKTTMPRLTKDTEAYKALEAMFANGEIGPEDLPNPVLTSLDDLVK